MPKPSSVSSNYLISYIRNKLPRIPAQLRWKFANAIRFACGGGQSFHPINIVDTLALLKCYYQADPLSCGNVSINSGVTTWKNWTGSVDAAPSSVQPILRFNNNRYEIEFTRNDINFFQATNSINLNSDFFGLSFFGKKNINDSNRNTFAHFYFYPAGNETSFLNVSSLSSELFRLRIREDTGTVTTISASVTESNLLTNSLWTCVYRKNSPQEIKLNQTTNTSSPINFIGQTINPNSLLIGSSSTLTLLAGLGGFISTFAAWDSNLTSSQILQIERVIHFYNNL